MWMFIFGFYRSNLVILQQIFRIFPKKAGTGKNGSQNSLLTIYFVLCFGMHGRSLKGKTLWSLIASMEQKHSATWEAER